MYSFIYWRCSSDQGRLGKSDYPCNLKCWKIDRWREKEGGREGLKNKGSGLPEKLQSEDPQNSVEYLQLSFPLRNIQIQIGYLEVEQ